MLIVQFAAYVLLQMCGITTKSSLLCYLLQMLDGRCVAYQLDLPWCVICHTCWIIKMCLEKDMGVPRELQGNTKTLREGEEGMGKDSSFCVPDLDLEYA